MAALHEGIANNDGTEAHCFWPRHALQTIDGGKTVDYVICFECFHVHVYEEGGPRYEKTTREPQAVFDQHLTRAGIPIAPQMPGMVGF